MPDLETLSEHALFGGVQGFYRHASNAIGLPMRFGVYRPPQAVAGASVPALIWLAGLTDIFSTLEQPLHCQSIAIFKQEKPDGRFRVLTRLPFGAAAAA